MAYLYNGKVQVWNNYGEGLIRTIGVNGYIVLSEVLFLSNGDIVGIEDDYSVSSSLIIFGMKDNYQSSKILVKNETGHEEVARHILNNLFYYLSLVPDKLQIYDIYNDYKCILTIEEELKPKILINNMLFITHFDIMILDIAKDCKCLYRLKGHIKSITDLLFIDKNQLLLSGSYDCTIKVWDANNNYNCMRTIGTSDYNLHKFSILKNGYFAKVFYGNNTIMIWDSINFKCVNTLDHDFCSNYIKLLEDNRVLSCSFHGNILI
jgi:WD40 repeat protein